MAQPLTYQLFETALGWLGIAWSENGIAGIQTPDSDRDATERRLKRRFADRHLEPATVTPPAIRAAMDLLMRYAEGEAVTFDALALDLSGAPDFNRDIYRVASELRYGETVTYGELARRAGHEGLARETGKALGENPVPIIVPCHRIVAAGGKIGGFSAPGGSRTKVRLLTLEGVHVGPEPAAQSAFAF